MSFITGTPSSRFLAAFVAVGATFAFLRRSRQIREHEDYAARQSPEGDGSCRGFSINVDMMESFHDDTIEPTNDNGSTNWGYYIGNNADVKGGWEKLEM